MIKIVRKHVIRNDSMGLGHFKASRGKREHSGVDLVATPGDLILSPVYGKVVRIGYPYASGVGGVNSDPEPFKLIEVVSANSDRMYRFFYVEPLIEAGQWVEEDEPIGTVQDLTRRYDGMTPHVHFELHAKNGMLLDPTELLQL